ncbi:MAG: tRNA-dihydrouridine synthase family protein [Lentisphaerae bacterium]|nr:tRNA-dihydrouridine synthase family protein [Lentisphaerota bacterium]
MTKLVLAPLADFTDAPFRLMCFEGGADMAYTEMVSAAALAHGHRQSLELMETMAGEGVVGCQLFGSNPEELAFATDLASKHNPRFAEVNLNAGCPMAKVTRSGSGAKLVESPESIYRLLKAMAGATDLPVTLKTRLGPHPQKTNIFEIVDAAERAGAKGISIHARYTSQMHGGMVHLDTLAEVVSRTSLPVTGNGSVTDASSARAMAQTGVAGIMIGRAAMARPWIFSELKRALGDEEGPAAAELPRYALEVCERHLGYVLKFRDQLAEKFPDCHVPSVDGFASVKMHLHLFRYFNGIPGAAALRARLNKIRTLDEIRGVLSSTAALLQMR